MYIYITYIYMYIHITIHICTNTHIHTYTYTHAHAYKYTHSNTRRTKSYTHSHSGTHRAWYWSKCIHTKRQAHSQINTHLKSYTHSHIVTPKFWCGPTAYVQKCKHTYIHTHKYAHICTTHTYIPTTYKHTTQRGALDSNRYDHRDFWCGVLVPLNEEILDRDQNAVQNSGSCNCFLLGLLRPWHTLTLRYTRIFTDFGTRQLHRFLAVGLGIRANGRIAHATLPESVSKTKTIYVALARLASIPCFALHGTI